MPNKNTLKERESLLKNNAGCITCQCGNPICLDMVNDYWFNLLEQERKEEQYRIKDFIEMKRIDAEKHPMKYSDENEMKEWNHGYDYACKYFIEALSQNTTQEEVTNNK